VRRTARAAQHSAGEIDVQDGMPVFQRRLVDRARTRAAAGIVEQRVEAAELCHGGGEDGVDLLWPGDIARQDESAPGDPCGFLKRIHAAANKRDVPAGSNKNDSGGAADCGRLRR